MVFCGAHNLGNGTAHHTSLGVCSTQKVPFDHLKIEEAPQQELMNGNSELAEVELPFVCTKKVPFDHLKIVFDTF